MVQTLHTEKNIFCVEMPVSMLLVRQRFPRLEHRYSSNKSNGILTMHRTKILLYRQVAFTVVIYNCRSNSKIDEYREMVFCLYGMETNLTNCNLPHLLP